MSIEQLRETTRVIMRKKGIRGREVANIIGKTECAVSHALNKGGIDGLIAILDACGYEVRMRVLPKGSPIPIPQSDVYMVLLVDTDCFILRNLVGRQVVFIGDTMNPLMEKRLISRYNNTHGTCYDTAEELPDSNDFVTIVGDNIIRLEKYTDEFGLTSYKEQRQ